MKKNDANLPIKWGTGRVTIDGVDYTEMVENLEFTTESKIPSFHKGGYIKPKDIVTFNLHNTISKKGMDKLIKDFKNYRPHKYPIVSQPKRSFINTDLIKFRLKIHFLTNKQLLEYRLDKLISNQHYELIYDEINDCNRDMSNLNEHCDFFDKILNLSPNELDDFIDKLVKQLIEVIK